MQKEEAGRRAKERWVEGKELARKLAVTRVIPKLLAWWFYFITFKWVNYYRGQFLYFIVMSIVGGLWIWFAEYLVGHGGYPYGFVDYWFLSASSMSQTGLNTNDLTIMGIQGLLIQMLMTVLGSQVLLSVVPVVIRIYYFHKEKKLLDESPNALLEYKALKRIVAIVPLYFLLIHVSAWLTWGLYVGCNPAAKEVLARNDVAPAFWTFFHVENSFSNTGYSLFFDNYEQWSTFPYILLNNMFVAQCGDVGFPVTMYMIVFSLHRMYFYLDWKEEEKVYRYLLKFPRRCFCYLFPLRETLWLAIANIVLFAIPSIIFLGVEWNKPALSGLSGGDKVMNGISTIVSTRHGGWNNLNIDIFQPISLVLIIGLMYVATSPITIAMRMTDPNEEVVVERDYSGTLHIIQVIPNPNKEDSDSEYEGTQRYTLWLQSKEVLTMHMFWIFLCYVIIVGVEVDNIQSDPSNFSLFNIFFEIVSGYGTTGLSWGLPNTSLSLCGGFSTESKILLIGLQILGRHRGMPQSVDKAIQLAPDMIDVQYAKPVRPALPRINANQEIELQDLGTAASAIRAALGMNQERDDEKEGKEEDTSTISED